MREIIKTSNKLKFKRHYLNINKKYRHKSVHTIMTSEPHFIRLSKYFASLLKGKKKLI